MIIRISVLMISASFVSGCNAEPRSSSDSNDKCVAIVSEYVSSTRGWRSDDYEVGQESVDEVLVGYSVMYKDDKHGHPPEEIKSFHVDLDSGCSRVVRELGYQ